MTYLEGRSNSGRGMTIPEDIGLLYDRLGEETIRSLVDRFYGIMDTDPAVAVIRRLHPADLSHSKEKLFMFLVGRFGGPPWYVNAHGHPRLRARHMPFPIGDRERDQWMICMTKAVEASIPDAALQRRLIDFFSVVADSMKNR